MVVEEIVDDGDRKILYGSKKGYHLIADPNAEVQIGDTVEYEPCGFNFGWFRGKNIF